MDLSTKIRAARERASLTQEAASKLWRINLATLRQYESGRRIPRGLAMEVLTDILNGILEDKPASASSAADPGPDGPSAASKPSRKSKSDSDR